ncbi:hypothetical protein YC2023_019508 [Brassica napus]
MSDTSFRLIPSDNQLREASSPATRPLLLLSQRKLQVGECLLSAADDELGRRTILSRGATQHAFPITLKCDWSCNNSCNIEDENDEGDKKIILLRLLIRSNLHATLISTAAMKAGQRENNNRKAKATKKQENICLKHRNHNQ